MLTLMSRYLALALLTFTLIACSTDVHVYPPLPEPEIPNPEQPIDPIDPPAFTLVAEWLPNQRHNELTRLQACRLNVDASDANAIRINLIDCQPGTAGILFIDSNLGLHQFPVTAGGIAWTPAQVISGASILARYWDGYGTVQDRMPLLRYGDIEWRYDPTQSGGER